MNVVIEVKLQTRADFNSVIGKPVQYSEKHNIFFKRRRKSASLVDIWLRA